MKLYRSIAALCLVMALGVSLSALGGEVNSTKIEEPAAVGDATDTPAPDKKLGPVKLIVIDPGHGGVDSGARGPGGVMEKDVTLNVAKLLKGAIEKDSQIKVVLTRDSDVYISLRERSDRANRLGADLFLSIHANAAKHGGGWGFESYFLSVNASDDDARALALMENYPLERPEGASSDLPPDVNSDLEAILFDMAQAEYIRESESLAMIVQDNMATIMNSPNRGVKQAPFHVLIGAAMPAVLVEIGFVSNRQEVELLTNPEMQENIALALAVSVEEFAKIRAIRLGENSKQPPKPEGS